MSAHKLRIVLTARARRDLREIELHSIQTWGSERAEAYSDAIDAALQTLTEHPEVGAERDDLRPGPRCLPVEWHLIL